MERGGWWEDGTVEYRIQLIYGNSVSRKTPTYQ